MSKAPIRWSLARSPPSVAKADIAAMSCVSRNVAVKSTWATLPLFPKATNAQWITLGVPLSRASSMAFTKIRCTDGSRASLSNTFIPNRSERPLFSSGIISCATPGPMATSASTAASDSDCTELFALSIHRFRSALLSFSAVGGTVVSPTTSVMFIETSQIASGTASAIRATGHQRVFLSEADRPRMFPTRLRRTIFRSPTLAPNWGVDRPSRMRPNCSKAVAYAIRLLVTPTANSSVHISRSRPTRRDSHHTAGW